MPEANPFEAERKALLGYFEDIFVDGSTDTEGNPNRYLPVVDSPNRRQAQPNTGSFVNVSIQSGIPFNRTVGTTATRAVGFFTVEVFIPEGEGTQPARGVAGLLEANFHNFLLIIPTGRIRFFEVSCRDVPSGMDGFGKVNVAISFWVDKDRAGVSDPLFALPENGARGYIVRAPDAGPVQPPSTLGLATTSNAALDPAGNIILRNSTTSAFSYLVIQGTAGQETVVGLDSYSGQTNLLTDANGNMLLLNQTTGAYLYPFIRGTPGGEAVVASVAWVLPGRNWNKDSQGTLLLYNVDEETYQPVSFQGVPGAQTLQPIAP